MVANERGQLLLIGGVAIAIVVFSTILFAHSLAVTDGITTTGSADTIERSADREASVERDLGRLAAETRGDDLDGFEGRYENALQNYTRTHNRVVASSGGTYLNATLNESASSGKEANLTRSSNNKFQSPSGPSKNDWTVVENVTRIAVFNITADKVFGGPAFTVIVGNSDGELTLTIDSTGSGNSVIVNGTTQCSGPGTVRVDLVTGSCTAVGGINSSFDSYHNLKSPYSVEIKNGNKAKGKSQFAAVGNFTSNVSASSYTIVPAVDTTYDTPSASYNRTVLVEVDDG
ncbi:hypothetical protein [Haloarcula marismortui]|uniref:Uncharacterized protein n=1 Tax=Haloarcula marismortui ATCC 33800 TaxID=662476 RepID=M0KAN5_9EURY|nr:hypothetical protein [Haloarcula sinaiiensis]EMA17229.1 hypothetical protein C436_00030 [Haloarcula sinaiiensis ATCC 33800]QUJ72971.1 hypothetical protein KDQ40_04250 [Haloarcula sinaiiensis ATCC 33800]